MSDDIRIRVEGSDIVAETEGRYENSIHFKLCDDGYLAAKEDEKRQIDRMRIILGADADTVDDETLYQLLLRAKSHILSYCKRTELTKVLEYAQVELAVIYYNRMGIEGESAHSEGSVSRSIALLPDDLRVTLNGERLLKGVRT